MRVLAVTSLFPSSAAPAHGVFIRERLAALHRLGAEVRVVAPVPWVPPGPVPARYARLRAMPEAELIAGMPVLRPRYLMVPKVGLRMQAWSYARGVLRAVAAEVERFRPHLIDAHYLYPDACGAAQVARSLELPYVCSARGTDVKVLGRMAGARHRIQAALARAAALIAVSRDLAEAMRDTGLTDRPVTVIPNGVDAERFRPRPRAQARRSLGVPEAAPAVIVCVAHLRPLYRQALLVRALADPATPPGALLYLVGEGPEREPLLRLARALGVADRLHLIGAVPPDQVPLWLAAADVAALLSERAGCPNAVLEAQACGTPCLATDLPEMREVLHDPAAGRLVSPHPPAIARALQAMLEPTGDALRPFRPRPRTWTDVAHEVLACFEQALGRPAARRAPRRPAEPPAARRPS